MRKNLFSLFIILTLLLSACSSYSNKSPYPSQDPEAVEVMETGVDCSTAESDLELLKEEKKSVGKKVLAGVRSVLPIAVVAGLLMGDYTDRVQVATGKYNRDLENKIAEIKKACGIS